MSLAGVVGFNLGAFLAGVVEFDDEGGVCREGGRDEDAEISRFSLHSEEMKVLRRLYQQ